MAGNWLAFDIGGDFVFGQKFCTLTTTESRFVINAVLALNRGSGTYAQSQGLAKFRFLDLAWPPVTVQTFLKCLRWRQHVLRRLKDKETTLNGLFHRVLDMKDPETGEDIPYNDIMAEAQLLQVAGKPLSLMLSKQVLIGRT